MAEKIQTIITAKDKGAKSTFSKLGASAIALNQGLELAGKAMRALSAPFAAVIDEGRKFGAQMSAVQAVSKATSDEMAALTAEAKRLGATTAFSGIEAASAMEELGRAGQSTAQIIETTGQALNLAAANGIGLADAAELTAIQMNIFKKEGLTANKAVDLINQTISSSPQNFEQFQYAMQYAAQTASSFNRSFEETTQIIGALAETGVRGSSAGTALSMAFARLANPVPAARDALAKYGITLDQINPETNKFADIIDVLNEKAVTNSDLFEILGARTAPKFLKIISEGGDAIRDFSEKQKQANTALEAAETRLNNLDGDITLFNSALSGLKLSVFETMDVMLRAVVQGATALLGVFDSFVTKNEGTFAAVFNAISAAMDGVGAVIETLINTFGTFLKAIGTFIMTTPVLQEVADNIVEGFGLIWDIVKILAPLFWRLAKIVGGLLFDAFKVILKVFAEVANVLQKILLVPLRLLRDLIVDFPDHLQKVARFFAALNRAIKGFSDTVNDLIASFGKLVTQGFNKVLNPIKTFIKETGLADAVSKLFDETLTGNTLSVSVEEVGQKIYDTGDAWEMWRRKSKEALEATKKLDEAMEDLAGNTTGAISGGGVSGLGASILSAINAGAGLLKANIKDAFKDISFTDVIKSLGNALLSVASSIWSLFTSNEDFKKALDAIMGKIGEALAPIIEAFIPVLDVIAEAIEEIAPLFAEIVDDLGPLIEELMDFFSDLVKAVGPIIKMIISKIVPLLTKIMEAIGPALIKIVENIGPLIETILDILIPIIEELLPIITDILDLISELIPLITAILSIIKALMPIIRFVIRVVAAVVNVIVNILRPIIQLVTNAILMVVDIITWLVTFIENFFGALFNGIRNALIWLVDVIHWLVSWIKAVIDAIVSALGGGSDGGPNIWDPRTWHEGGPVEQKDLIRLPGMASDEGIGVLQAGEHVLARGETGGVGGGIVINIKAIDPRATADELRRLLEELKAQRKI